MTQYFTKSEIDSLPIFEKKDRIQTLAFRRWKENNGQGLISAATGVGKSRLGVMAAQHTTAIVFEPKILVVVPTEKLRDKNWAEEFTKWNASAIYNKYVTRCCYASLTKQKGPFDLVILDEAHNITIGNSEFFQNEDWNWVLALTATPPKEKEKKDILKLISPQIFNYTLDEAVRDGLVTPYEIYIINSKLDEERRYIAVTPKGKSTFYVTEKYKYDFLCKNIETKRAELAQWGNTSKKALFDLQACYGFNIEKELQDFKKLKLKELYEKYKGWPPDKIQSFKEWREAIQKFEWVEGRHKMAMLDRMRFIYNLESKTQVAKYLMDTFIVDNERTLVFCGSIKQANELCGEDTFHSGTKSVAYNRFCNKEISVLGVVEALNEGHNIEHVFQSIVVQVNSNDRDLVQRIGRNVRFKEGALAKIFIIRCKDTQDETWIEKATAKLDQSKIYEYDYEDLINS